MVEERLFESEQSVSRADVADYLRTVADRLDAGDELTLRAGGEAVTLAVPDRPTFEVTAEREGEELSVEFELEWREGQGRGDGDGLAIE